MGLDIKKIMQNVVENVIHEFDTDKIDFDEKKDNKGEVAAAKSVTNPKVADVVDTVAKKGKEVVDAVGEKVKDARLKVAEKVTGPDTSTNAARDAERKGNYSDVKKPLVDKVKDWGNMEHDIAGHKVSNAALTGGAAAALAAGAGALALRKTLKNKKAAEEAKKAAK